MPRGDITLIVYEIVANWKKEYKVADVKREISAQAMPKSKIKTSITEKDKKENIKIEFKASDSGKILSKEELEEILYPLKITELLIYRNEDEISDAHRLLGAFLLSIGMVLFLVYVVRTLSFYAIIVNFNLNLGVVLFAIIAFVLYYIFSFVGHEKPIEIIDSYEKDERTWMPLTITNIKRNAVKLLEAADAVNDPKLTFFLTASSLEETAKYIVEKLIFDLKDSKGEKEISELKQKIYEDHLYKYRVGFLASYIVKVHNLETALSGPKQKEVIDNARKVKDLRDGYLSTSMRTKFSMGEYVNYQRLVHTTTEDLLKESDRLLARKDKKEILLKMHELINK